MINVTLKDGSVIQVEKGSTLLDVAGKISEGFARKVLSATVDGKVHGLPLPLEHDCAATFHTFEDEGGRLAFRHTCSHVLAQAVKRLYPEVKLAIGPAIDDGFYYDVDSDFPFTPEILAKLEAEMRKIIKENIPLIRFEMPRPQAIQYMESLNEPYKVELIQDLPEDAIITFYSQGDFTDLCAGPHLVSTGKLKGNAVKLTSCTGAYWRGDSKRKMLQRIYGTCFPKKEELDAYLQRIEEAKKRDHRKLGKELGLFAFRDEAPGFPFYLPKGMVLRNTLIDYCARSIRNGTMWRSPRPRSCAGPCGRPPATGTTTRTTCTPPSSTGRTSPSNP